MSVDKLNGKRKIPQIVGIVGNNRLATVKEVNKVIAESNITSEVLQNQIDDLKTQVDSLELLSTTVTITSAQILDLGNTPVELLPDPGTDKYYGIQQILFEMSAGTTAYSGVQQEDVILNVFGGFYGIVNDALLTAGFNSVATLKESVAQDLIDGVNSYYPKTQAHPINAGQSNVLLTTYSGDNPTLGDGTLRVIISYSIRTFGE